MRNSVLILIVLSTAVYSVAINHELDSKTFQSVNQAEADRSSSVIPLAKATTTFDSFSNGIYTIDEESLLVSEGKHSSKQEDAWKDAVFKESLQQQMKKRNVLKEPLIGIQTRNSELFQTSYLSSILNAYDSMYRMSCTVLDLKEKAPFSTT